MIVEYGDRDDTTTEREIGYGAIRAPVSFVFLLFVAKFHHLATKSKNKLPFTEESESYMIYDKSATSGFILATNVSMARMNLVVGPRVPTCSTLTPSRVSE